VLFDLALGRADVRPDREAGYAACVAASSHEVAEGCVGAGTGATVAKLKGHGGAVKSGLGTSATRLADGTIVAALVAVNALGNVVDPSTGEVIAAPRAGARPSEPLVGANTSLGIVATTARLDAAAANRLATVAHDGLAQTIRPAHTQYDGDTIFAISQPGPEAGEPDLLALGAAAAQTVADAIVRAVRTATPLHGVPAVPPRNGG
jgi:L-aminopeptidase/D-esterase-like protein